MCSDRVDRHSVEKREKNPKWLELAPTIETNFTDTSSSCYALNLYFIVVVVVALPNLLARSNKNFMRLIWFRFEAIGFSIGSTHVIISFCLNYFAKLNST